MLEKTATSPILRIVVNKVYVRPRCGYADHHRSPVGRLNAENALIPLHSVVVFALLEMSVLKPSRHSDTLIVNRRKVY